MTHFSNTFSVLQPHLGQERGRLLLREAADDERRASIIRVEAVPKHWQDELACLHEQDSSHRQAMGFHSSPLADRGSLTGPWASSTARSPLPRMAVTRSGSPKRAKAPTGCSSLTAMASRSASTWTVHRLTLPRFRGSSEELVKREDERVWHGGRVSGEKEIPYAHAVSCARSQSAGPALTRS